ncbi:hypothetical protein GOHSU_35_00130 [Gordonia hirsuta DSM 44140 = NBRC 16056]|uniref:DUF885 domain-containing protein n=1 Tax=Gordonia hirsuta DSM 44140 = NBRC 16056 TaxID=1121927 RepID=L7LDU4_9ACTN|nr:hypothetical protein [Gordonia hirsuta]GAC58218.1 hypothetical protein GOHSU_35_00130 [Gordonia hirsuta DSM 44140 = NBRC 16056]
MSADAAGELVDDYLRLGLAFDRLEPGFVDAYTGDPALRAQVENAPAPAPAELVRRARELADRLPAGLPAQRAEFLTAHLRALECSARKFAGEQIGFVDEVKAYFDVDIAPADQGRYAQAHAQIAAALGVPGATGTRLREAYAAYRRSEEIPPELVRPLVAELSGALREIVRSRFGLPETEVIEFEIVSDKPWSGFNYYLGHYRSRVAINTDLPQYLSGLPALVAHEAYPGHHTEHCRKEQLLVGDGQREQSIFLVNTPQCLMAEGLADHALAAAAGPDWQPWAAQIYADFGLRFDVERSRALARATAELLPVRQDAALALHDGHRDADEVTEFLQRWLLAPPERARQMLRFLTSPLWRAYISTYVEGYELLGDWLSKSTEGPARLDRFRRLLDEPLTPARLRAELAA